jgi:hypothetical protein
MSAGAAAGTRYRGAQPFGDDELSQRTFFGRDDETAALTNQVLANRLIVVYAKSGVGKSSILNAGIVPRLREAGYHPLLVRVNDIQNGPIHSLRDGVRAQAARQGIEYVDGDSSSLWSFFKTIECWRGDVLLTPVLIIDQFEELFTLHNESARDSFLAEMGHVIRGVPTGSFAETLSDTPPALHVVLSLREDYLGVLEDASDHIPQIMDHRFRLAPLSRRNAALAIGGPAAVRDDRLATAPFTLDPSFADGVLDYLSQRATGLTAGRYVEPFHLQLICQRVEQIVAETPAKFAVRPFTRDDFGGEPELARTLQTFYANAIGAVSERRQRRAARRLCEQFLISPEGRRLSLEQHELRKQLGLSEVALTQLVDSRLLRTDRRSESMYYELSHDALVEPVLATRRTQALLVGWTQTFFGLVAFGLCSLFIIVGLDLLAKSELGTAIFLFFCGGCALPLPLHLLGAGVRTRRRFKRHGPTSTEAHPIGRPRLWLGNLLSVVGIGVMSIVGLLALLLVVVWSEIFARAGQLPDWLSTFRGRSVDDTLQHPLRELGWTIAELTVMVLFGHLLLRLGRRMLYLDESVEGRLIPPASELAGVLPVLRVALSVLGIIVAIGGAYLVSQCRGTMQGRLPGWLPVSVFEADVPDSCKNLFEGHWTASEYSYIFFLVSAFLISVPGVWRASKGVLHRGAAP